MDCETKNLLYAISCTVANCRQQYIGTTYRSLRERFREHLGYVDKNVEATGTHYNLPGHSKADMKVMVVDRVEKTYKHRKRTCGTLRDSQGTL